MRFLKGDILCNKGIKGTHFSPNTEFKKGHKTWLAGLTKENGYPENIGFQKGNTFGSIETRFKKGHISWNKNKHHSEKTKRKISENKERAIKISRKLKGKPKSEEHKRKLKQLWQNPEFVKKMLNSMQMKPTKPEKNLNNILQKYLPNEYAYNGDFSQGITFGGLIPDFINVNGQKIAIEVFGDYWHTKKADKISDTEEGRKEIFSKLGWKLIVIWEHELKNLSEQEIINKIKRDD